MHGRGIYKWPDGGEYEGEYIHNIKEGQGVFKWASGRIFKGPFVNGKPHGKGVLTIDNTNYDVEFIEGKLKKNESTRGNYFDKAQTTSALDKKSTKERVLMN